ETTANQLSLCILSVLSSAELAALLRADPSLTPVAVAEIMRLSPALSVMFPRVAVERMSIAGRTVEAGDPVLVSVVDANRRRREATARHFTFGHGVHRCIGAPLARLQLTEALHGLVERFPAAEPAEDPSALAWKAGQASRGLSRLYVNLAPTAR
uniref:cytochrome P450 n=1 Tax=Actinoplanes sp. RD1 TaxID=3064538 RepID=UPI002741911C